MTELKRLFSLHMQVPFPTGATTATAGLKADLVAYDSYVAGYITTMLDGARVDPSRLVLDRELDAALDAAGDEPFVRQLKEYKSRVDELVLTARRAAGG
jgi:hypothetical protein